MTETAPTIRTAARMEIWAAYGLLAACFLGIAPVNAALGAGLVLAAAGLWLRRYSLPGNRLWLVLLGGYLLSRIVAAGFSPDPAHSFRYIAKDWRMLALVWAATGVLARPAGRAWVIPLVALAANSVVGILEVAGVSLAWLDGLINRSIRYGANLRTGSFLGLAMTQGGVMMLALFLPALVKMPRWAAAACWTLAALMLALSGVRGAWMGGIAAGVWAVFRFRRGRGYVVTALVIFSLMVLALPTTRARMAKIDEDMQAGRNIGYRVELWKAATRMAGDHPVTGVGPGRFKKEIADYVPPGVKATAGHAHSVPFHMLAEGGVVGLAGIFLLYLGLFLGFVRSRGRPARLGEALIVAMVVAGLTELNLYDGEVGVLFFLIAGHALHLAGAGFPLRVGSSSPDPQPVASAPT